MQENVKNEEDCVIKTSNVLTAGIIIDFFGEQTNHLYRISIFLPQGH